MTAPRVLVIDDNAVNVELARFVLEEAGFDVDAIGDGAQAMARIADCRPDLILMDIQLPGADGLDLTRTLKSDPATRGIAVIAFTAFAMKGDELRMRAAGCDGYLAKPIDVAAFGRQVREILDETRAMTRGDARSAAGRGADAPVPADGAQPAGPGAQAGGI